MVSIVDICANRLIKGRVRFFNRVGRPLFVFIVCGFVSVIYADPGVDAPAVNPGYLTSPPMTIPEKNEGEIEKKKKKPEFELPPLPIARDNSLSSGIRIHVARYRFEGNTVFDDTELEDISRSYLGDGISIENLHDLKRKITLLYINAGYINSGAILPDQEVGDGTVTFRIIEGEIDNITISGLRKLDERYVRGRIVRYADSPADVNRVQEGLLLLQQNTLIDRVNARLLPGERKGRAVLDLNIVEAKPYNFDMIFNNYRTPSVGSEQGTFSFTHRNISGGGDMLHLLYAKTEGLDQGIVDYTRPVGFNGSNIRAYYRNETARVVESPFDVLNIKNEFQSAGAEYQYTLKRTLKSTTALGVRLEHKNSASYFDGVPYSFTPGVVDGKSTVTRVELYQRYQYRGIKLGFFAESDFLIGTDWFGATLHKDEDLPDSRYFAWRGVTRMMLRVAPQSEIVGRGDIFWSKDKLLSSEKYPVGGPYSVRGYRESLLGAERAAVVSLEYRYAMGFTDRPAHRFQVAVFSDAAWMSNVEKPASISNLSSVGAGLRYNYKQRFHGELYYAKALSNKVQNANSLVEKGITLEIGIRW